MAMNNIDSETILSKAAIKAKQIINKKQNPKIVALTGSGISKASGIPTFRGKDGLWKNYDATTLATPQAFARDPSLVWEWYSWRIGLITSKNPNPAHKALVELEQANLLTTIISQNVDDLHKRAGSKKIIQVHGDILHAWCQKCGFSKRLQSPPKGIPKCECGNNLRPGVVWFGESLDHNILTQAEEIVTKECDILLVVGTSGIVYPVAAFPHLAKTSGVFVVEFNVERTPISAYADFTILGKSEETLPEFVQRLLT
jgi:NAD-dependent deacetylase